jgi:hypothetical protein
MTPTGGQVPPAPQLAQILDELRRHADLTWRALGELVQRPYSVMFRVGTGQRWPTWQVTEEFFGACIKEIWRKQTAMHGIKRAEQVIAAMNIIDLDDLEALWKAEGEGRRRR